MQRHQERYERFNTYSHDQTAVQIFCTGLVGRPAFSIPRIVLHQLLDVNMSVPKIYRLLGVSISTIRRRMTEYGLSVHDTYSSIDDESLDRLTESVNSMYPTWGVRQMCGHLISIGHRVQYHRVRE